MNRKAKPEFIIVWEFRVRSGKRREFEKLYGPRGNWAAFFRGGKGYVRTELIRDAEIPLRYLTLDFWASRQAYERFKKNNRAEYLAIDQQCEPLTESETEIGRFNRVENPARSLRGQT